MGLRSYPGELAESFGLSFASNPPGFQIRATLETGSDGLIGFIRDTCQQGVKARFRWSDARGPVGITAEVRFFGSWFFRILSYPPDPRDLRLGWARCLRS